MSCSSFGAAAVAAALFGRTAMRRRWPGGSRLHIAGMGTSYVLLLVGFYVDNGHQLPVWERLPHYAYWLAPVVVGAPLIGWALIFHPAGAAASYFPWNTGARFSMKALRPSA